MTTRITGLAIALLLTAGACKRREEATAPTPTVVPTVVPPAAPDVPMQPVTSVDAGPTQPGPNAMAQPGTLAPGAAPPTGAPPAPPTAPVAAPDAAAPVAAAPAAPAAPTAPTTARPGTNTNRPTEIRIPGVTNQPPINIDQHNGQTRVNVGGVQILIPGANQ